MSKHGRKLLEELGVIAVIRREPRWRAVIEREESVN